MLRLPLHIKDQGDDRQLYTGRRNLSSLRGSLNVYRSNTPIHHVLCLTLATLSPLTGSGH